MKKIHLFIVCALLTLSAWSTYVHAANVTLTMNLNASPAAGGSVSLDGNSYKASATDVHAGESTLSWFVYSTVSHDFYLYANDNEDYVFKGFATSESANSGNTNNPYKVTMSKQGALGGASDTKTYYAIFAKMKAESEDELAFGQVLKNHSKSLSVTVKHVHAGSVTASLQGNEDGLFAITSGSSASSNQNEVSTTVTVTYSPVESETEASATLVITSNNGLSTISIPLSGSCPPQLTPEFTLPKTEIELEETVAFTFSEFTDPQVVVADESIVSYDAVNHTLTGLALGSTTVTLTQEETGEVLAAEKVFTVTVTKINPLLAITEGGYAKTLISILPNGQTTIGFSTRSNAELSFVQVSGEAYVSYNNDTHVMSAIGKGVAEFVASQPENDRYFAAEARVSVWVKSKYHVPVTVDQSLYNDGNFKTGVSGDNSWYESSVCVGGENGWLDGVANWDDKYVEFHFEGIPDKLSFEFKYIYRDDLANKMTATAPGSSSVAGEKYFLYIEESADRANWTPISWQHTEPNKSAWLTSGDQQLKKTTRYLRFHLHANYGALYRNIHISELKYVEDPVPSSIDLGTAVINSGEVKANPYINWCNIAPMSVVSSNDRFTVTPASFGNYEEYGTQVLEISYTHSNVVGAQEADITISNTEAAYTKTIHVTANTTKRPQTIEWNADLAATGFAMNTDEQYPDALIPTVATATNGERVTFISDNPDVIEVIADTALLAKAVGTANITAYQVGDNEYDEVSDTKQFVVTELLKQTITWDQNFLSLLTTSEPVALTATASSGGEVTYSSGDEHVVTIIDGVLTVVGEGETYITATQGGGEINEHTYLSISMNNYVIVRNPASQCNGLALAQGSLTLGSQLKRETYNLFGIPQTLTFSAYHGEKSANWGTGVSYAELVVDQYACINGQWDWYTVFNQVVGTSASSYSAPIDETATKIRFSTGETAVNHTITDIRVTRQKFMRSDVMAVDENVEANATWQKTIIISHSNIDLMTVTSKQGLLNINVTTLGEGCDDFNDDAFTVSFTPTVKYEDYYDTIVITDEKAEPTIIEIPVHLFSQGLNQVINDFELAASCLTTDVLEPFHATATSGLELVYLSSDSTIAYVDENKQLIILAAGTVTITAYQAGDDRFESASDAKTIEIQLTPTTITEAPQATEIAVGQSLANSKLIGGQGSVEGSFAWQAPETTPVAGDQTFTVVFTPTNNSIYAAATTEVTVHVEDGQLTQTITWEDVFPELFYQGMSFELTATASSELPVEYTSSDETIARIEGTTLYPLAAGTVTISALQNGNEFYFAAEPVEKLLIVSPIPTTYGEYQAAFCDGDSVEFAGNWYFVATADRVLMPEKNIYGGDSIVAFTATVLPRHFFAEDTTINMDDSLLWREKEYGLFTPGTYTLYDSLKNIEGCDSVYALQLTVNAIPYLFEEVTTACEHEDALWRDRTLPTAEAGTFVLYDSLQSIYGMDSVYQLTLTVYPTYALEDEAQTIYVGATAEWRGIDLSLIPVGDTLLTKTYSTLQGCDSVYTMHLTVNEAPTTYGVDSIYICGRGDVAFYDNAEYSKPSKTPFTVTLSTPNQFGGDSIVELWVLASNKYDMSFSKEIKEGDEEEWQGIDLSLLPAGDTTLVVIYTTVHGCDSTFTLHLTVKPVQQTTTALDKADAVEDKPYKFFHNGQMYIRKNGQLYNLQGIKVDEE